MIEKTPFMVSTSAPDVRSRSSIADRRESGGFERMLESVKKRWNRSTDSSGLSAGPSRSRESLEERLEELREKDEEVKEHRASERSEGEEETRTRRSEESGKTESTRSAEEPAGKSTLSNVENEGVDDLVSTGSESGEGVENGGDADVSGSEESIREMEPERLESGDSAETETTETSDENSGDTGVKAVEDAGTGESDSGERQESPSSEENAGSNPSDPGESEVKEIADKPLEGDASGAVEDGDGSSGSGQSREHEAETGERSGSARPTDAAAVRGGVDSSTRESNAKRDTRVNENSNGQLATNRPELESGSEKGAFEEAVSVRSDSDEVETSSLKATREALEKMMHQRRLREGKTDLRERSETHLKQLEGRGDGDAVLFGERTEPLSDEADSHPAARVVSSGSKGQTEDWIAVGGTVTQSNESSEESFPSPEPIREWIELRGGARQGHSSLRLDQMPVANLELRRQILPSLTRSVSRVSSGDPTRQGEWNKHQVTLDDGQKLNLLARREGDVLQLKLQSANPELNRLLVEHQQEIRQHLEKECGVEIDLQFDQSEDSGESLFDEWMEPASSSSAASGGGHDAENEVETTEAHTRMRSFGYNRMEWTG